MWCLLLWLQCAACLVPYPPSLQELDEAEVRLSAQRQRQHELENSENEFVGSIPNVAFDAASSDSTTNNPKSLNVDKVKQQSGYLSTGDAGERLFYWFFESRNNPATDPVLVWLNGGPGCSSMEAVLFENGPSFLEDDNTMRSNPHSWNNFANVLYIDNPAGVGYSETTEMINNAEVGGREFSAAIQEFFKLNPGFRKNAFHISGESYAGRYIPVYADAINSDGDSLVKVSSILIGNGLVDPVAEHRAYQPFLCGQGGRPAVLTDRQCQQMAVQTPKCLDAMEECVGSMNKQTCRQARRRCDPLQNALRGKNPYDIRSNGCPQSQTGLCYPELDNVQNFYDQDNVQQALGATRPPGNFQICNNKMNANFYASLDPYSPTYNIVTKLLNQGTPVLVYNGDADIILNWLGGRDWTTNLKWNGQDGFQKAAQSPRDWIPERTAAKTKRGEVTNSGNFTFLRLKDAGHMVPHDQPESADYMIQSWLSGDFALSRTFP